MKRLTHLRILFFINLLTHLLFHYLRTILNESDTEYYTLITISIGITKMLVVILALGIILFSPHKTQNRKWIIWGLILGWIGDLFLFLFDNIRVFLELDEEKYLNYNFLFLFGLGAFLLGHVSYVVGFWKDQGVNTDRLNSKITPLKLTISGFLIAIYALLIFSILKPYLGEMLLPVVFYIATISAMLLFALKRPVKLKNYRLIVIGALLFVASDSILAFELFKPFWDFSPILVMLTYGMAQYIIATGYALGDESFM